MNMRSCAIPVMIAILASPLGAQNTSSSPKSSAAPAPSQNAVAGRQYAGMYSFLNDGEFVQITVEPEGKVTGFVSRYGNGTSDKGAFLDQFFKTGKLEASNLSFTTETVHGVWFDFKGTVERGAGKNAGDEAFYVLKGTLTESTTDVDKKISAHSRQVVFKMFPQEASPVPTGRR